MTADELRKAETRYQRASARAEQAREARNRLVREAVAAGWTHAKIAAVTGLTRGRVGQLAQAAQDRRRTYYMQGDDWTDPQGSGWKGD